MKKTSDEQQIREVIATWLKATAAGDLETVLGLMAPDVVFLTCGNPPMRGRKAFTAATRQVMKVAKIRGRSEVQEVTVAGTYAYCWNHLTITLTPTSGGRSRRHQGHVLSVFRKERDGRWVIWRDANLLGG